MELSIYNTCETTRKFFLTPHKLSKNPYEKITAVASSIFVGYLTFGAIHLGVGISYLTYKAVTYLWHSNKKTPQSKTTSSAIEVTQFTIPKIIITPPLSESKTSAIQKTKIFTIKKEIQPFELNQNKKNFLEELKEKEISTKKKKEATDLTIKEKETHAQNMFNKFQKHVLVLDDLFNNSTSHHKIEVYNNKAKIFKENENYSILIENLEKTHMEKIGELEKMKSLETNNFEEEKSKIIERQEDILNEEKNMLSFLYRDAPLTLKKVLEELENSKNLLFEEDAELSELVPSKNRSENEIKKYAFTIEEEKELYLNDKTQLEQKYLGKINSLESTVKIHEKNIATITLNYNTEKNHLETKQRETMTNLENEIKHLKEHSKMLEHRYEKTIQEIKEATSNDDSNKKMPLQSQKTTS